MLRTISTGALLAAAMVLAPSAIQAQGAGAVEALEEAIERCEPRLQATLQQYELDMAAMEDVEWFAIRRGPPDALGPVHGYRVWMEPPQCEEGNLVADLFATCHVQQVYTEGGCQIDGIPSY